MNEILSHQNPSRYFVGNASVDDFVDAFESIQAIDENDEDSYEAFYKATGKSFHEYLRQFDDMV